MELVYWILVIFVPKDIIYFKKIELQRKKVLYKDGKHNYNKVFDILNMKSRRIITNKTVRI